MSSVAPSIISSLILPKNRRVIMEVFSPSVRNLWKEWEPRALVLLSLMFQIILIILGNRRKYIHKPWISFVVWSVYLAADSTATIALGVISSDFGNVLYEKPGLLTANTELSAFWAPFLLLHLGGPDTITSYSLEDNELWARHFLGLIMQTGVAVYIFLMAWTGSYISILSIIIMSAGLIKYGERTWVLRSASIKERKASSPTLNRQLVLNNAEDALVTADEMFETTKNLFSDDGVSTNVIVHYSEFFSGLSSKHAWRIIEVQLGLMFDMLYTKAIVVYSYWGIATRLITTILTFIALVSFSLVNSSKRKKYSKVDLTITFLLLIVAMFLEIYAALVAVSSDQSLVWLRKQKRCTILKGKTLSLFITPRWSNSMGQYSFLGYFLHIPNTSHYKAPFNFLSHFLNIPYASHHNVSDDLKEGIFHFFHDNIAVRINRFFFSISKVINGRGLTLKALHDYSYDKHNLWGWCRGAALEQVILVWHITTEICYYLDYDDIEQEKKKERSNGTQTVNDNEVPDSLQLNRSDFVINWRWGNVVSNWKLSKHISRYLMHLYVMDPMLQGGLFSRTSLLRTCDDGPEILNSFLKHEKIASGGRQAQATKQEIKKEHKIQTCRELLSGFHSSDYARNEDPTDPGIPEIIRAMKAVADLTKQVDSEPKEQQLKRKWRVISGTWMELLSEAAYSSKTTQHAQNLRCGGELLTHVWLLMVHCGFCEQEFSGDTWPFTASVKASTSN